MAPTSPEGAAELIVDAHGIHAWYGSSHVLHGATIQIARGQTVGLLGHNGMGKSTLIRTLLGHVAQRDGHITLFGKDARASSRTRSHVWAWPTCQMGAACSPTCRCARTW
jgi:branched-chain amino acid transport system ATP-binding protein